MSDNSVEPTPGTLRDALRRPKAKSSHHLVDFLLGSAYLSTLRLNLMGWAVRGVALTVAVACALLAPSWALLLIAPSVLGWFLAGIELFRHDIMDVGAGKSGVLGKLWRHLASSRGRAIPTLSAVLENGGAFVLLAAFIGPFALDLEGVPRDVGLVAAATYLAVAAAQVVTDSGYYNREPGREPAPWVRVVRWVLVPFYVGLGALALAATGGVTGWVAGTLAMMFASTVAVALVSDNIQAAALLTHLSMAEERSAEFAAELSAEVHRATTGLAALAEGDKDTPQSRAFELAFAEIDAIRVRASYGMGDPPTISEVLALLERKYATGERIVIQAEQPDIRLTPAAATLLRLLVMDLVANARTTGADRVQVQASIGFPKGTVPFMTLKITDNGPGFANKTDMTNFAPGSSREALARMCTRRRGSLTYERINETTVAHAYYRTDLFTQK